MHSADAGQSEAAARAAAGRLRAPSTIGSILSAMAESLTTDDLLFVSFASKVFALHRGNGSVVWKWKAPKGTGLVTVLPDGDRLFASCQGYTWALDPCNGAALWFQELKGEGMGTPMLATMRGASPVPPVDDDERTSKSSD
jgi:outer membrane protein assembly factor BamB